MRSHFLNTFGSDKSRKPKDTPFFQQTLPAWQPVITAGSLAPFLFVLGIAFVPIGIILIVTSTNIHEISVDYTQCISVSDGQTPCSKILDNQRLKSANGSSYLSCVCEMHFHQNYSIHDGLVVYYGLTNFYQNHRKYVKSKDDVQLNGHDDPNLSDDCEPYRQLNTSSGMKNIAPCGMIANSLFNDTFRLFWSGPSNSSQPVDNVELFINRTGIAWDSDRNRKYGRPSNSSWWNTVKPPSWSSSALERTPGAYAEDEALLVWMRVAALPTFRKMYGSITSSSSSWNNITAVTNNNSNSLVLPRGEYRLLVNYSFPVSGFQGTKRFILTTRSWLGGRNMPLGVLYLVVGGLLLVLALLFTLMHWHVKKRILSSWRQLQHGNCNMREIVLSTFQLRLSPASAVC